VKESFQLLDRLAKSTTGSNLTSVHNDPGAGSHDDNLHENSWKASEHTSVEPLNTVLTRWKKEYLRSPRNTLHPRQVLAKVDEWKKLMDSSAVTKSPQSSRHQQRLEALVRPNTISYTCIMQAVGASVDGKPANQFKQENLNKLLFIDALLDRLLNDSERDISIQPNVISFATVMNAWAQSSNNLHLNIINQKRKNDISSSSERVEELLQRMETLHQEGLPNLEPNVVVYNILLHVWAKEGKIKKIEETLQRMIRLEIPGVSPDPVSYSTLLSAYSKVGTPEAALKADSLLHQMLELYNHGMESAKPNIISFTNVVQCYAQLGDGEKAEEWLRRLRDLYQHGMTTNSDSKGYLDPEWKPDVGIHNVVIQAWVKSGHPQKAENFLRSMVAMDEDVAEADSKVHVLEKGNLEELFVQPNSRSFNIVLSAWAKNGEAERAEAILMEMHRLHVEEDFDTRPNVVSYNTVLDSYAKKATKITNVKYSVSGKNLTSAGRHSEDSPWDRAEAILNHMIDLFQAGDLGLKPTAQTWNTVINVCAKEGKIEQAERVLDRMASFFFTPAAEGGSESKHSAIPSTRTWNTLLSSCMTKSDIRKAKQFWSRMKENGVQPDIVSYNTLLNCFVRSRNKRTRADNTEIQNEFESIIRKLRHDPNVSINHITYLAIVNFWINQKKPKKAEIFLLDMAKESGESSKTEKSNVYKNDAIDPSRNLFHYVLTSWGDHKKPKKAEELLLKMAKLSDDHKFNVRPTTETYNRLLNCWAKSMKIESGERAEVILREMEALGNLGDKDAIPDIYSYNSVLNAWANSGDAAALTRIDKLIFEMILTGNPSLLPDSFSYGTWLKAIASSAIDKEQRVREVVKTMTIHNFQPNDYIRQRIQSMSTPDKG